MHPCFTGIALRCTVPFQLFFLFNEPGKDLQSETKTAVKKEDGYFLTFNSNNFNFKAIHHDQMLMLGRHLKDRMQITSKLRNFAAELTLWRQLKEQMQIPVNNMLRNFAAELMLWRQLKERIQIISMLRNFAAELMLWRQLKERIQITSMLRNFAAELMLWRQLKERI
jgi:hypothetical protein